LTSLTILEATLTPALLNGGLTMIARIASFVLCGLVCAITAPFSRKSASADRPARESAETSMLGRNIEKADSQICEQPPLACTEEADSQKDQLLEGQWNHRAQKTLAMVRLRERIHAGTIDCHYPTYGRGRIKKLRP
jgi:hypothetical protein